MQIKQANILNYALLCYITFVEWPSFALLFFFQKYDEEYPGTYEEWKQFKGCFGVSSIIKNELPMTMEQTDEKSLVFPFLIDMECPLTTEPHDTQSSNSSFQHISNPNNPGSIIA